MKRIAIIGSGISGLVAGYCLSKRYAVTLFEANDYLGGHTHTVSVHEQGQSYPIDTGFIVFNYQTYPLFTRLLQTLNIPVQASEMSFSYRSDTQQFEYNGHNLNTLFADRRQLFNKAFYCMLADIMRFNRDAKQFLRDHTDDQVTISTFLQIHHYGDWFIHRYLIPMMSAIWSKRWDDAVTCSARFVLQFFNNHGLLEAVKRPTWYVIQQGSAQYIPALTANYKDGIQLNTPVKQVVRTATGVTVMTQTEQIEFDAVVIATHSDQALQLLKQPTATEAAVLSQIQYVDNDVVLHTDATVMPRHKRAWASWNYLETANQLPTVTYYMNRLQALRSQQDYFVSLNMTDRIEPSRIIQSFSYAHPLLNQAAVQAQKSYPAINGVDKLFYVGSYWYNGFHEDGVRSAIETCEKLGATAW